MTDLLRHFSGHAQRLTDDILQSASRGQSLVLSEVAGGARALLVSLLAQTAGQPIVVVTSTEAQAGRWIEEYEFYTGGQGRNAVSFPAYDVSPYESVSPSQRLIHRRMDCLHRLLAEPENTLLVVSAEAFCHRTAPRDFLASNRLELYTGDEVDRDELARKLTAWGYSPVALTEDVGDFSVRGSLVDIFPPTSTHPVRLDLFGDTIEQMRLFHPENQRTREVVKKVSVLPCREIVLSEETCDQFERELKELADALSFPKNRRDAICLDAKNGVYFPGVEFLLPLFYTETATLADYLPEGTLVVFDEWIEIDRAAKRFTERVSRRYDRHTSAKKLSVEVEKRYVTSEKLPLLLEDFPRLYLGLADPLLGDDARSLPHVARSTANIRKKMLEQSSSARMLQPVADVLTGWTREEGSKALLVASGRTGLERLRALLSEYDLPLEADHKMTFPEFLPASLHATRTVSIMAGSLRQGFSWEGLGLMVLTEEDLFGEKKRRASRQKPKASQVIASFGDLQSGDFVVHSLHGIGIYRGLVHMDIGGIAGEYLLLEYAGRDKLYLPVDRLSLVQRYVGGEGGTPAIDKLGGTAWERAKKKAKKGARKMAGELLRLYAERMSRAGFAFSKPDNVFREFEATFPYEETPDQESVISEVLADMTIGRPMDRLVCGDVGFGKTEIALRAAFLAVLNGKQVAVLVPTTTLAFQHLRTFKSRLSAFGARVAMLSRFVETKQRKEAIEGLKSGKVDVLVGTHQLLSKQVQFKDLGLLIVDEEQHFGVAQKEKIKSLKSSVDVLTLTATPIPRTFHMSLSGIRDLSIIETPPEDRLAVRTFVTRYEPETIREALTRELARGGQAFFIHNRVKTIFSTAERIQRLVPSAHMAVGHGQMDKKTLEKIMIDFSDQKVNLLVSTAIVESGLDFPTANTIMIDRADTFGLSQLYQLRGRVGRSDRRAYAYLLIPSQRALTPDAQKRLAVLKNFTALGSGFKIAAHDLEIRGAGNLLGSEQSGSIHEIGYELYQKLLEEAIAEQKGEEVVETMETEVNLRIPAYIPEDYIPDERVRLTFYKRLSEITDEKAGDDLAGEMADRFGETPDSLRNLFQIMEIKRLASALFIQSLDLGSKGLVLQFDSRTPVSPAVIVELVASKPGRYALSPEGRLMVTLARSELLQIVPSTKKLLQELA